MRRTVPLLIALGLLGGCGGASHSSRTAGRRELIAALEILRRPPAPGDSGRSLQDTLVEWAGSGTCVRPIADPGLTRRLRSAPAGGRVYLVAFRPDPCVPSCTGTERACMKPQRQREESASLVAQTSTAPPRWMTSGRWTAGDIARGRSFTTLPWPEGGPHLALALVPDGIERVTMRIGRLGLVRSSRPVSVAVHSNLAALAIAGHQYLNAISWRGPGGAVVSSY